MKTGIYIHIPFCKSKCPYCDFYSLNQNDNLQKEYTEKLISEIKSKRNVFADTIYIGGGTPSVLDGNDIARIVETAKNQFSFNEGEITVEANPSSLTKEFAKQVINAGVNRFSLGVQSVNDSERKILGRKSSSIEIIEKINMLKSLGIDNISLDVMLAIPNQTKQSLQKTLDFCIGSDIKHISAYILKIEENTFFYKNQDRYNFPDEDESAELYEFCCGYLQNHGFEQYEISNFAKKGFESKHNLKYWNSEEYLGFGTASHSFYQGKRFFHGRDIKSYIDNPFYTTDDGNGGDFEEFAMLKLRLTKGLLEKEVIEKFEYPIPEYVKQNAKKFTENDYLICDEQGIRLTQKGFLISNYIISEII